MRKVDHAALGAIVVLLGSELDRAGEVGNRLITVAGLLVSLPAEEPGDGEVRVPFDRPFEIGLRLAQLALPASAQTSQMVDKCEVGPARKQLIAVGNAVRVPLQRILCSNSVHERIKEFRLKRDGTLEIARALSTWFADP